MKTHMLLYAGLPAVLVFAFDRLSKWWIVERLNLDQVGIIDVAPPYLRYVMAWNEGVNFGLFASADMRWALIAISLAISVGALIWAARRADALFTIGAGIVVGGAIGNALDRLIYGAVADFLNMSCCGFVNPWSFNVADAAIFAGAALIILRSGDEQEAKAAE